MTEYTVLPLAYHIAKKAPDKTIRAYKLFRLKKSKPGKLFTMFVHAGEAIPIGCWLCAQVGDWIGDPRKRKVKSKIGPLAFRPGWHLSDLPLATHIGVKDHTGKITAQYPDTVWAECEVADDYLWQKWADACGWNNKTKKINPRDSYLPFVPEGGLSLAK